jgi:mRNA-degrading endonuclease YafQ of YafQ-DinJ toxin-antitoxin module
MRGAGSVVVGVVLVGLVVSVGVAQEPSAATPHGELRVALDCGDCHTETGWKPAKRPLEFEHNRQTAFPLTGRHEDAACGTCHLGLRFDEPTYAEGDCASCHVDVHQGNLSENCVTCHTTVTFTDVAGLSVHARTSFPLTGAHLQVSCESCHTNDLGGAYTTLDTDCLVCHEGDYTGAASVDHAALQFSTDCTECHSTLGWGGSGGDFDHVTVANGFALVGAHAAIRCESCHVVPGLAPLFPGTGQDNCFTCHEPNYQRSHSGSATPTDCVVCHNVNTWEGAAAEFDHASVANGFELVGAHAPLECASCHIPPGTDLIYTPAGQDDCVACHQADYDTQHAGTGFPVDCLDCHTVDTWIGATFDHATVANGFDLVGAHAPLPCASCHILPGMELIYTPAGQDDCVACHQADYDTQHAGTGFPVDCLDCHTVDTWIGATFDHATVGNGFELVGAHAPLPCASCHILPGMELIYTPAGQDDCIACRQADYDTQHAGTGFPTDCLVCHTVDTWMGAQFVDHDGQYFPIYSGAHSGRWDTCQTCHEVASDFTVFTCFNCHEHDQASMDSDHQGRDGYVYESTACYSCHPDGRK